MKYIIGFTNDFDKWLYGNLVCYANDLVELDKFLTDFEIKNNYHRHAYDITIIDDAFV